MFLLLLRELAGPSTMADAVAPGGWLVVEEPDQTAFGSAVLPTPLQPPSTGRCTHVAGVAGVAALGPADMLARGGRDLWAAVSPTLAIEDDDFEVAIGALGDPTFSFVRLPIVRAWARRPAEPTT